jgi:conjugal transfer ATP-binding protein TraC
LAGSGEVSRAGRVIIENSYWKLFGMISSTSRNAIRNSKRLSLTEYEWNLLESVHPLAGEYGEMLLISEAGAVKVRIVLDDFMKALFFTDPETRRKRYELVKQGYSWKEAIEILRKEKAQ